MYGTYNPYGNPIDRIDNQIKELENLRKNYQNMPQQQPINQTFQLGNFKEKENTIEVKYLQNDENAEDIIIQNKTMFIKNNEMVLKNINGDIVEKYEIKKIFPIDEKDLKIQELERRLSEYEQSTNVVTNNEEQKPTSNDTKSSKK